MKMIRVNCLTDLHKNIKNDFFIYYLFELTINIEIGDWSISSEDEKNEVRRYERDKRRKKTNYRSETEEVRMHDAAM